VRPLRLDEHREALVEGERLRLGVLQLFLSRGDHSFESHRFEFLHRRFRQHVPSFLQW
jgi:hypothetical protein